MERATYLRTPTFLYRQDKPYRNNEQELCEPTSYEMGSIKFSFAYYYGFFVREMIYSLYEQSFFYYKTREGFLGTEQKNHRGNGRGQIGATGG